METLKKQFKIYQQLLIVAWVFRIIDSSMGAYLGATGYQMDESFYGIVLVFWIITIAVYIYFIVKLDFEKTYFSLQDLIAPRKIVVVILALNIILFLGGLIGMDVQFVGFFLFCLFIILLISIKNAKKLVVKAQNELNTMTEVELETSID